MVSSSAPQSTVILCDSLEKVFAEGAPRALDGSIPVIGYHGERASFQVAIYTERRAHFDNLRYAKISISAPYGVNSRVRAVDAVPVSLPAPPEAGMQYLRTAPGLYPDLLRPLADSEPFSLLTDRWQAAWIDLEISEHATVGESTVQVMVSIDDETSTHELPFRVVGHTLPPLDIVNTHWFHSDGLIDYYALEPFSEEFWEVHKNFLQSAADMTVNSVLTPVWTPPLDTAEGGTRTPTQLLRIRDNGDGDYCFDPEHLRRWLALCRDAGMRYLEMPHLFTQWGARATPAIYVDSPVGTQRRFGWDVPATDPSYRELLEQMLPYLFAFLEDEWGLDRIFFHISDEPTEEHLESYSAAKAVVDDLLADVTVVDAISSHEFFQRGLVALPVVATNHARTFLDREVEPMWLYYCVAQSHGVANRFIAMSSAHNRVLGNQLYLSGAAGFLHWGFNFYNAQLSTRAINPFLDTSSGGGFYGGDAFMVYPGPGGEPMTSIRYEVFREAMLDHRAARLLEHRVGTAATRRILSSDSFDELGVSPDLHPDEIRRIALRVADALSN